MVLDLPTLEGWKADWSQVRRPHRCSNETPVFVCVSRHPSRIILKLQMDLYSADIRISRIFADNRKFGYITAECAKLASRCKLRLKNTDNTKCRQLMYTRAHGCKFRVPAGCVSTPSTTVSSILLFGFMSPSIEAFKSRLMGIPATQTSI